MSVLVDSTIWSMAFRRKTVLAPEVTVLSQLIRHGKAQIIGPVRQEVLSGIRESNQFDRIRVQLAPFPDLQLSRAHYERAAEFSNLCRARGIQGSNTDFLICAVSDLNQLEIYTTDRDFQHFTRLLPIQLFKPPDVP